MYSAATNEVLAEKFMNATGLSRLTGQLALLLIGVLALIGGAKASVPLWPVPMTMGTFSVLVIGAAYGPRLGGVTLGVYLFLGAIGLDVFAGSSAESSGLRYMVGNTGGYLIGYALAIIILGCLARKGWDRSPWLMACAMAIGNVLIYLPGLAWLGFLHGWDKPILQWGLVPFLPGDVLKLALASLTLPAIWRLVDKARGQ